MQSVKEISDELGSNNLPKSDLKKWKDRSKILNNIKKKVFLLQKPFVLAKKMK